MKKTPFAFLAHDGISAIDNMAWDTIRRLLPVGNFGIKINIDALVDPRGSTWNTITRALEYNRPLFIDLKMWNGGRTILRTLKAYAEAGAEYVTVHALADDQLSETLDALNLMSSSHLKVLATTILTHYTEEYCQEHFRRTRREAVRHFAEVAHRRGCHGIVLPGIYLDDVRDLQEKGLLLAVPGIRLTRGGESSHNGPKINDPEVELLPEEAATKGADIIVCGSPIVGKNVADPLVAMRELLTRLGHTPTV